MSTHRLSQYPDLTAVVAALPADQRVPRVQRLAEHAAAANGVLDECRMAANLANLVARHDDAAWSIQESIDLGTGSDEAYAAAFQKARAASAWMYAAGDPSFDDCCDATYEALFALDDDGALVVALLTADLPAAPGDRR